jgi:hypothetical protein
MKNRVLQKQELQKKEWSWASVAHTCNPRYSRGRDQEDCSLKPAPGKYFSRPYLKKPITKRLVDWLKV